MARFDLTLAYAGLRALGATSELTSLREQGAEDASEGARFPDHPSLRAVMGALMCAGPGAAAAGWRSGEDCAELVVRIGLDPIRVRLHAWNAEMAWREVSAVTPLALDVLAVVVDRLQDAGGELVLVRCADVLEAKRCQRWGEERLALEQQVGRELLRLGAMTLGVAEQPLFSVTPLDTDGGRFVIALDPAVKALWDVAPQRRLNWRLLDFDHRANRGADVLAMKMGFYFSMAGTGSQPVVRSIRAVLKGVGALGEASGGGRGGRLADRFEEAVLRLHERGLVTVTYRGSREPSILDERVKGWVTRWLETTVVAQIRQ
ncbi:hypothetical protein LJR225_002382 [Phenylobacterium sp. LjRoot225]|uniref:hypothetical protein n=1 Tax=Phenylobacterium sp. LjRoot225 TaxID=3342285 RepID=UPI003ECE10AC